MAVGSPEIIQIVVKHAQHTEFKIFVPALRCIGNFATANELEIIDQLLFHGALDCITNILMSANSNLIKECCWALSNIAASSVHHVEALSKHHCFSRLIQIALSKNLDNRKEALWVICNALTGADPVLRTHIVQNHNPNELIACLAQGLAI